ncbi:hypothetical protein [Halobacillus sp. A5]|uniref:hypothetical protein n=1 Tax=Halobacillus sp. A5 TaxID=2880263 RepID=UPI0020A6CA0E|nr:hypothetical protein [Halobacillus sp. A5]MCP3028195.1 hypothetical protein [Halobacillus sp. A5]
MSKFKKEKLEMNGIMDLASNLLGQLKDPKNKEALEGKVELEADTVERAEQSINSLLNNFEVEEDAAKSGSFLKEVQKFNQQVQDLKQQMNDVRAQYSKVSNLIKKK